tara:strand:+ start:274 stop:933 length:660 start_codon:yes stop_codon:yes gene_type:complete
MNIVKIILSTFVILSCSEKQVWQELESGKTIKVFSQGFQVNNSNYIYKWSKPIGPDNSQSDYKIEHDKLLFTPITPGQYYISLEIVNMMQTKVYEESFYFNVLQNEAYPVLVDSSNKKINQDKSSKKMETVHKKDKNILKNRYTIQVASWTSLEKAKNDTNELIKLGFDTYIEEYFDSKNNITRWRVRIGSFESKSLAIDVKKRLSKFRGEDPWIAFIK